MSGESMSALCAAAQEGPAGEAAARELKKKLRKDDRQKVVRFVMASAAYAWRERLKIWRAMSGLTTDAAAAKLGSNRSTLNAWETGRSKPTRFFAECIERMTGIPLADIEFRTVYGRAPKD